MKEFDGEPSNISKKGKSTSKKHNPPSKLFAKNCWPKVMISRDNTIYKKTTDSTENSNYSFLEEHSSKFHEKETKIDHDLEHLYCNETEANFEEEQRICLISSSSETRLTPIACKTEGKIGERLTNLDESLEEHNFDCSTEENEISKPINQGRPIFVDLTADDKNTSGPAMLKCCSDRNVTIMKKKETEKKKTATNVVLDCSIYRHTVNTAVIEDYRPFGITKIIYNPLPASAITYDSIKYLLTTEKNNDSNYYSESSPVPGFSAFFCSGNLNSFLNNLIWEHRIMIADSSSKISCNGTGSIATALRDRGPCLIPVQPNRSLPIRPVPSVPTRSYRKDSTSLLISPKSSNLNMDESVKSNKEVYLGKNINSIKQMASKDITTMVDYVVHEISNKGTDSGTRKRDSGDIGNMKVDAVKEHRKKKRQQADCNRNKEEDLEYTAKKCLRNLYDLNTSGEVQNLFGDKSSKVVFMGNEESGNKVVPPLRLKKIVRTESEEYAEIDTGTERESKYRIITDTSDQSLSSTNSTNWNDMLNEKDRNLASLNTDSYKLKYRRNRLKQKLRELRSKALELAKQMANDSHSQQSTRLRQVMNRYEKQIENLAKLHSKLSAALPMSKEVIDVNDDSTDPPDDAYPLAHLKETSGGSVVNDSSPRSSPEPPKLSPRSPINYDNVPQDEGRNSPPILPRVCPAISSNQESTDEELPVTEKKVWPVNEESLKAVHLVDSLQTGTTILTTEKIVDIENSVPGADKGSLNHSRTIGPYPENDCITRVTNSEMNKSLKGFSQCCLVIEESEKIKCPGFSDSGPAISSVTSGVGAPVAVRENEMFELLPGKEVNSSTDRVLHSGPYESAREDVSFSKVNEASHNVQKVTSSTGQSTQLNSMGAMLTQDKPKLQQNAGGHSLTEQFPTLGNWLARLSKKQVPKANSKVQTGGNVPLASAENIARMRIPGLEMPKPVGPHTINDGINATSPCNTNKWQYHLHQQQRQQLLQHVASSVTLSQPIATIPPLRPGMCPPMPMSQYYPNNYAVNLGSNGFQLQIDPYNGSALAYHPTICPYGTYPYHNRIHSNSLPGYHLPMQDNLRAMHHADKRFPTMQDPMVRYPSPSTSTLQHRSNLEFDLRGNSGNNNVTTATCLSSLFLPPPTLSPSHQGLPRPPLLTYPTNSQFSRNRMIPDVVAAAAAAAVVAAASFGRQRDTLTYNKANTDALSTTGITNVIDGEPAHIPDPRKSVIGHPDVSNHQAHDGNFNEESHENTKYEQMQNFLLDHLTLVKTADNLTQTNVSIDNDNAAPVAPIVSTTPYGISLIPSHGQLPKNISANETRSCETPHLGKMNRSPDSLHNFACSNCGVIGPKFKCLGCEMAFYCGERCQEKHWYVHVQKCPKKMPKLKKVA